MKKLIRLVLALSICVSVFGGCTGTEKQSETTATTTETTTVTTTETTETETVADDLLGEDDTFMDAFNNIQLSSANHETISADKSLTYKLLQDIADSETFYMDVSVDYSDGKEGRFTMATEGDKIFVSSESDGLSSMIYIMNNEMKIYDPSIKTAISMPADKKSLDSSSPAESFRSRLINSADSFNEKMNSCVSIVNGKKYTFEYNLDSLVAYIYDENDKLVCLISDWQELIINDLTSEIPDGIWEQPEGYNEVSMAD